MDERNMTNNNGGNEVERIIFVIKKNISTSIIVKGGRKEWTEETEKQSKETKTSREGDGLLLYLVSGFLQVSLRDDTINEEIDIYVHNLLVGQTSNESTMIWIHLLTRSGNFFTILSCTTFSQCKLLICKSVWWLSLGFFWNV